MLTILPSTRGQPLIILPIYVCQSLRWDPWHLPFQPKYPYTRQREPSRYHFCIYLRKGQINIMGICKPTQWPLFHQNDMKIFTILFSHRWNSRRVNWGPEDRSLVSILCLSGWSPAVGSGFYYCLYASCKCVYSLAKRFWCIVRMITGTITIRSKDWMVCRILYLEYLRNPIKELFNLRRNSKNIAQERERKIRCQKWLE